MIGLLASNKRAVGVRNILGGVIFLLLLGFLLVFFMSAFLGAISYFFNYIFQELVSQPVFAVTLTHFPITLFICGNLHWLALIMIIYGSITLYGKRTEQ